jgi:branched-chain amino acid transport system substrate-binding protein
VPITRGVGIRAEEFNAADGIRDATGTAHKIVVTGDDNECYAAGGELTAFRRAILDEGNQIMLQTFTPASRKTVADMTTGNKVQATSYAAGFLGKDYPYLMGSVTGSPASYMYLVSHLLETRPDIKKVSIVTTDNSFGQAARAFYPAGIAPQADRVEIVLDSPHDPAMANDMPGLATPIATAAPDLIVEPGFTPGQPAAFIEAMGQLGYAGLFGGEGWTMSFVTERVAPETLAGRLFSAYVVDASEASFSPRMTEFFDAYVAEHGVEEWTVLASVAYAAMTTLEVGIQGASARTGQAVREVLFANPRVEQPLFGTSSWGGAKVYGVNTHLLTPLPVHSTDHKGNVPLTFPQNKPEPLGIERVDHCPEPLALESGDMQGGSPGARP